MLGDDALRAALRTVLLSTVTTLLVLIGAFVVSSAATGKSIPEITYSFTFATIGSSQGILQVLTKTTPLLISTIGLIVAFRSGFWNIGGEGQIIIGILTTTGTCLFFNLPPFPAIILSFAGSFLVAGAYAALAGFLKAKWGVNEVVITMMQTSVAVAAMQFLVNGPWNWGGGLYPRTEMIPTSMRLPFIADPLNAMLIVAALFTGLAYFFINRTVVGYEMKAMGENTLAALCQGINTSKLAVLTMMISGGLCGLAGTGLVLGEFFRAQEGMSGNYGFYAIAAALMADNQIVLAPFSALLIAVLYEGVLGLAALGIPHRLGEAIVGIVFILAFMPKALNWLGKR